MRKYPLTYVSGAATNMTDLNGLIDGNLPICIELTDAGNSIIKRTIEYVREGGKVMVDSGAFRAFMKGREINFTKIMHQYDKIADSCNGFESNVSIVAPDVVGERRPRDAWKTTKEILWTNQFVVGIPGNAKAFSEVDLIDLLKGGSKPAGIHFLGMTPKNRKFWPRYDLVRLYCGDINITTDGAQIRSVVGEGRQLTVKHREMVEDHVGDILCGFEDAPETLHESSVDMAADMMFSGEFKVAIRVVTSPIEWDEDEARVLLQSIWGETVAPADSGELELFEEFLLSDEFTSAFERDVYTPAVTAVVSPACRKQAITVVLGEYQRGKAPRQMFLTELTVAA